jgi:hypothetical protein
VDAGSDEGRGGMWRGTGHGAVSRDGETAIPCGRSGYAAGGWLAGREWGGVEGVPRKASKPGMDRGWTSGAGDNGLGPGRKVREVRAGCADALRGMLGRGQNGLPLDCASIPAVYLLVYCPIPLTLGIWQFDVPQLYFRYSRFSTIIQCAISQFEFMSVQEWDSSRFRICLQELVEPCVQKIILIKIMFL